MTGISFLAIFAAWVCFVIAAAINFPKRLKSFYIRLFIGIFISAVLLPMPLVDEMVAQRQFDELCKEGGLLHIDEQGIKGREIKLVFEPANAPVYGLAVPVIFTRVKLKDSTSGDEFGSYSEYTAEGGVLSRAIGLSEKKSPIWMSRSYCAPNIGVEQMANFYMFKIFRK